MTAEAQESPRDSSLASLRASGVRALIGPTAVGKSALGLAIAERCDAEVVVLDSMQVYRGMDVGTAKPTREERARVRHHMLDLVDPREDYDVSRWLADLEPVLADAARRGRRLLFVGGTGFYLKVLLDGMFAGPPVDRELRARLEARVASEGSGALHAELARADVRSAARIHANDAKRIVRALEVLEQTGRPLSDWQKEWSSFTDDARATARRFLVGLELSTARLDERIRERTRAMLDAGWADEALAIEARGGFSKTAIQALGYREALELAHGRIERDACADRIALATRQFARRQRTWWRKFDDVAWISPEAGAGTRADGDLVEAAVRALDPSTW